MKKFIILLATLLFLFSATTFAEPNANENSAEYLSQKAKESYEAKDYDSAVATYTKIIELDPANSEAYGGRGLSYHKQEKYDLAMPDFN